MSAKNSCGSVLSRLDYKISVSVGKYKVENNRMNNVNNIVK